MDGTTNPPTDGQFHVSLLGHEEDHVSIPAEHLTGMALPAELLRALGVSNLQATLAGFLVSHTRMDIRPAGAEGASRGQTTATTVDTATLVVVLNTNPDALGGAPAYDTITIHITMDGSAVMPEVERVRVSGAFPYGQEDDPLHVDEDAAKWLVALTQYVGRRVGGQDKPPTRP
jgi:hypothetical protein